MTSIRHLSTDLKEIDERCQEGSAAGREERIDLMSRIISGRSRVWLGLTRAQALGEMYCSILVSAMMFDACTCDLGMKVPIA